MAFCFDGFHILPSWDGNRALGNKCYPLDKGMMTKMTKGWEEVTAEEILALNPELSIEGNGNLPASQSKPSLVNPSVKYKERDWQREFEELAHTFGWTVAHFRHALKADGTWITPVSADGAGFPDNILAKPGKPVIFAELKTDKGTLSSNQKAWLSILRTVPGIRVFVWRPKNYQEIVKELRE